MKNLTVWHLIVISVTVLLSVGLATDNFQDIANLVKFLAVESKQIVQAIFQS